MGIKFVNRDVDGVVSQIRSKAKANEGILYCASWTNKQCTGYEGAAYLNGKRVKMFESASRREMTREFLLLAASKRIEP